jgi:hypothetical protein
MSTLLLSLLLLVLIVVGLLMGRKVAEQFENPAPAAPQMSPALVNLLGTPALAAAQKSVPQVDKLARDQDAVAAANAVAHHEHAPCPKCEECKKCEKCPDMSQYIRMDEVPCWNCTLP